MAEIVGKCNCPICRADGADVKQDVKKRHFINCDNCCSLIRTMSRAGDAAIAAMMVKPAAPPVPVQGKTVAAESQEKPAPAKKRGGVFDDLLGIKTA